MIYAFNLLVMYLVFRGSSSGHKTFDMLSRYRKPHTHNEIWMPQRDRLRSIDFYM